ncbi:MAG: hypothetical protein Q8Q99_08365, partial [Polaromonas sp.]|nr:hypothetical protein [Polaromonas sp.]
MIWVLRTEFVFVPVLVCRFQNPASYLNRMQMHRTRKQAMTTRGHFMNVSTRLALAAALAGSAGAALAQTAPAQPPVT